MRMLELPDKEPRHETAFWLAGCQPEMANANRSECKISPPKNGDFFLSYISFAIRTVGSESVFLSLFSSVAASCWIALGWFRLLVGGFDNFCSLEISFMWKITSSPITFCLHSVGLVIDAKNKLFLRDSMGLRSYFAQAIKSFLSGKQFLSSHARRCCCRLLERACVRCGFWMRSKTGHESPVRRPIMFRRQQQASRASAS